MNTLEQITQSVGNFNSIAQSLGLLPIAIVNPKDCKGQDKNARYFKPEVFKQLVANIKKYGHLETVPLVYKENDKYRIISGHHRIEAAVEAGLEWIVVFVDSPESRDVIIAKQLAHNSLEGKDDPIILAELFNSIEDINLKLETGLENEIGNIDYSAINISMMDSKDIVLFFLPDDYELVEKKLDEITALSSMKPSSEVLLAPLAVYDKFIELLMKTKKCKNIKNNAIAFSCMLDFILENKKQYLGGE